MGTALNASSGRRRWSETPVARGLLFLGIVWSIAGAFLVLQNALPELIQQAVMQGWLSPEHVVDSKLQAQAARRCAEPAAARSAVDTATLRRTRYAAFQMGYVFGTAVVAHASGTVQSEQVARALQEVKGQAMALGVPAPELPVIRHMAESIGGFTDSLEEDRQCTTARLASRYTPAHGDLFRFGAVVAASVPYCVQAQCTAYATQIRRYGQAAGVPEHLWLPMAQGSLAGVPGPNVREKTSRVVRDLTEHIKTGG
jgi:hypothetical protein